MTAIQGSVSLSFMEGLRDDLKAHVAGRMETLRGARPVLSGWKKRVQRMTMVLAFTAYAMVTLAQWEPQM